MVNYQSFSFVPFLSCAIGKGTNCWNQKGKDTLFEILHCVKGKEFYLLLDEGGSMTKKTTKIYDLAKVGINNKKKVILATRWQKPRVLMCLCCLVL